MATRALPPLLARAETVHASGAQEKPPIFRPKGAGARGELPTSRREAGKTFSQGRCNGRMGHMGDPSRAQGFKVLVGKTVRVLSRLKENSSDVANSDFLREL